MERRLTAFVIPLLILVVGYSVLFGPEPEDEAAVVAPERVATSPAPLIAAAPPGGATAQSTESTTIEKTFGAIGEPGSYWIEFDRAGASVRSIRLLDEPASPEDYKLDNPSIDNAYKLVRPMPAGGGGVLTSLTLTEDTAGARRFGEGLDSTLWEAEEAADRVTFRLRDEQTGLTLVKTFRHEVGRRELWIELAIVADANRGDNQGNLAPGADARLWLHGPSLVNPASTFVLGNPAKAIGKMTEQDEVGVLVPGDTPKPAPERFVWSSGTSYIDFAGTTNRFFGAFLTPDGETAVGALHGVYMEQQPNVAEADLKPYSVPVANYRLRLRVPDAGQTTEASFRLYLGPKSAAVFDEDPAYLRYQPVMDSDLSPIGCFCDIPGAKFMSKTLLSFLRGLHSIVGSWGVAIILMTLFIRGAIVPLNFRMQKSMRAYGAKMMRLKPELDSIKTKYEKDPKKMQQEMLAFQRKHKLLPPFGGCLPLLITIPVFIGLFTALRVAYELRCQPFIGWINDLSQPDRLFLFDFWPGELNVLPILMVALWLVLQMGTPLPTDPQQRQMMKIMRFMPLLFGVMLYKYASGLMVYMVTSSLFGIIEQRVTRRILGPPPAMAGAAMPTF